MVASDYLYGNRGDDFLYAGSNNGTWKADGSAGTNYPAGNSTLLSGDQGNDTLTIMKGATGAFVLEGGVGNDMLNVKGGTQVGLMGGADSDTFHFTDDFKGTAFINDFNSAQHDHIGFDDAGSIKDIQTVTHMYDGVASTDTLIHMNSGGSVEIKGFDSHGYGSDYDWLHIG